MSEEELQRFEGEISTLATLAKLIRILLMSAFGIGVWVATLEWRHRADESARERIVEKIQKNDTQMSTFSLWKERTDANRFDSKMATDLSNNLTARSNVQDLRVQKLEIGQQEIQKSLTRIETKLGTN